MIVPIPRVGSTPRQLPLSRGTDARKPDAGPDQQVAENIALLSDEHSAGTGMAWLLEHPDRARPALLELVRSGATHLGVRRGIRILGKIGKAEDIPAIASLLWGEDVVAWHAAEALAAHEHPAAWDALIPALAGDKRSATVAAIRGMREHRHEAGRTGLERLLEARLKMEKDRDVRKELKKALGKSP